MDSGRLRQEKIDVYRLDKVKNEYGEYKEVETYVYTTRASEHLTSMNRDVNNQRIEYPTVHTLLVRYYVPIDADYLVKWKGKTWRVISVNDNRYFNNKEVLIELIYD